MSNLFLGFKFINSGKLYYGLQVKNFKVIFFNFFFNSLLLRVYFKQVYLYCSKSLVLNGRVDTFFLSNNYIVTFFRFFFKLSSYLFFFRFILFRVFKAHGINMRMLKKKGGDFFLRVGFSHGFFFKKPRLFNIKIYRKRYFIVYSYDLKNFELFSHHLRYLRRFFKYKLIGVKAQRDFFRIKVGKKKTF